MTDSCSTNESPPFWATSTPLENFAITLGKDTTTADPKKGHKYRVAAGPKGVKLEIKEPSRFFENVTLKSESAKKWLTAHISAAANNPSKQKPDIWILTGLVLLTHATWSSLSSAETFTPGTQAPFDPTGVSQLRRLSSSGEVRPVFGLEDVVSGGAETEGKKVGDKSTVHETGKYPGTRAWAAQWRKVDVEIPEGGKSNSEVGQLILKVKGGRGGEVVAEVEVDDDDFAEDGDGVEFDDGFWDKYLDEAEELL